MRYSPLLYARALLEALDTTGAGGHGKVIKNFLRVVVKNGDQSRMNQILELFESLIVRSHGGRMVVLETARKVTDGQHGVLKKMFRGADMIKEKVNPALGAGLRIELNGEEELDYSLAGRLKKVLQLKRI